jgi:hypothetical protein
MHSCVISPITIHDSTAAYLWRLLYATRYLQVPEGRAFLLDQLRRRVGILPYANHLPPCPTKSRCDTTDFVSVLQAASGNLVAVTNDEIPPPTAPPALKLDWAHLPDPSAKVEIASPPANWPPPNFVVGGIFDVLI